MPTGGYRQSVTAAAAAGGGGSGNRAGGGGGGGGGLVASLRRTASLSSTGSLTSLPGAASSSLSAASLPTHLAGLSRLSVVLTLAALTLCAGLAGLLASDAGQRQLERVEGLPLALKTLWVEDEHFRSAVSAIHNLRSIVGVERGPGGKPDPPDARRPGVVAAAEGATPHHPVVMVPGITSSALELWKSDVDCARGAGFRDKWWGSVSSAGYALRNQSCWLHHMGMDPETWMDPPGVTMRAAVGWSAADDLFPGYYVWSKVIRSLADVGYDPASMAIMPYDWRLSPAQLEERDAWFSQLRSVVEVLVARRGIKAALVGHSMGSQWIHYFLKWVVVATGDEQWVANHVGVVVNIAGPFLGVPKTVSAVLSGEMRDTAELGAFSRMVLGKMFGRRGEQPRFFRTLGSLPSMFPVGGVALWRYAYARLGVPGGGAGAVARGAPGEKNHCAVTAVELGLSPGVSAPVGAVGGARPPEESPAPDGVNVSQRVCEPVNQVRMVVPELELGVTFSDVPVRSGGGGGAATGDRGARGGSPADRGGCGVHGEAAASDGSGGSGGGCGADAGGTTAAEGADPVIVPDRGFPIEADLLNEPALDAAALTALTGRNFSFDGALTLLRSVAPRYTSLVDRYYALDGPHSNRPEATYAKRHTSLAPPAGPGNGAYYDPAWAAAPLVDPIPAADVAGEAAGVPPGAPFMETDRAGADADADRSDGDAATEAAAAAREYDDPRTWAFPLYAPLPAVPSLRVYCLYGVVGDPAATTEVGYHYELSPSGELQINLSATHPPHRLRNGIRTGAGDGTVPLISLGFVCEGPWRVAGHRLNPAGAGVVTREYPHEPESVSLRGGERAATHVEILGHRDMIGDLVRIVTHRGGGEGEGAGGETGGLGTAALPDRIVSGIRTIVADASAGWEREEAARRRLLQRRWRERRQERETSGRGEGVEEIGADNSSHVGKAGVLHVEHTDGTTGTGVPPGVGEGP